MDSPAGVLALGADRLALEQTAKIVVLMIARIVMPTPSLRRPPPGERLSLAEDVVHGVSAVVVAVIVMHGGRAVDFAHLVDRVERKEQAPLRGFPKHVIALRLGHR